MKKLILFCIVCTVILVSCNDQEFPIIDAENGQTLVSFGSTNTSLQIVVDGEGTVSIPVNVTTSSAQDRTFNVNIIEDATTALPGSFSVGGITIPANTFNGTLTIDGVDNNVETTALQLVLEIEPGADAITEGQLTVDIFQICPVSTDLFTGAYQITVDSPGVFGCGVFPEGAVVDLAVGGSDLERTFTTDYILDCAFGVFSNDFSFTLVCNEIVFGTTDTGVGCADTPANLVVGPATGNLGVYDGTDDSSFTVIVTDDVESDCANPTQAMYTFTRM